MISEKKKISKNDKKLKKSIKIKSKPKIDKTKNTLDEDELLKKLKKLENNEFDLNESLDKEIKMFLLNGLEEIKEASRENSFMSEDILANSFSLGGSKTSNKLDSINDEVYLKKKNLKKKKNIKKNINSKFCTNSKNTYIFHKKKNYFKKKNNGNLKKFEFKNLMSKKKGSIPPANSKRKIYSFEQYKINRNSQEYNFGFFSNKEYFLNNRLSSRNKLD